MFLKLYLLNRVGIKVQWSIWCFLYFTRKHNLLRLFVGSGSKDIFRLLTKAFILLKSLFKLVADKFILSTTEKSEASSAKSLLFVVRPSERLFIYIKNNSGPSLVPCGTPDSLLDVYCLLDSVIVFKHDCFVDARVYCNLSVWKFLKLSLTLVIIRFRLILVRTCCWRLVNYNIYLLKLFITHRWSISDILYLSEHLLSSLILTLTGRRVLQIFQKKFHSPGDHRPKYFIAQ